jgi:hypothetical protein
MAWPQNSVNAWMMGGVNNPIDSRVYRCVDMLSMGFPETARVSPQQKWAPNQNGYILQDQTWLPSTVAAARAGNSKIKLFVLLNYGLPNMLSQVFGGATDPNTMQAAAQSFAQNLASYLNHYDLDGFDIDWEPDTSDTTDQRQFVILFNAIGAAFNSGGKKLYLAFSPAPTTALAPKNIGGVTYSPAQTINNSFAIVTLQNYYASDYPGYPSEFTNLGISPALIAFGAKFESNNACDPTPYQGAADAFSKFSAGITKSNPYLGITQWRLNSGNYQWEQAQQMMLYRLMNPSSSFNDTDIVAVAGNPPITAITIRSGEVLDAIQATNTGSFTMDLGPGCGQPQETVPLLYVLPHGGTGGQPSSLTFATADPVTSISGYTGIWFLNACVLQITITTKSGIRRTFPSTISPNASQPVPFSIVAPSGKSIVAFSGTTLVVQTAGGGTTTIIGSLSASYA